MKSAVEREEPAAPKKVAFAALHHKDFRVYFIDTMLAMMADNIEHVISYWLLYQKFHSPTLAGFAVLVHWTPFLLFSVYFGAMADRYDCRKIIQLAQLMYMGVATVCLLAFQAVNYLKIGRYAWGFYALSFLPLLYTVIGADARSGNAGVLAHVPGAGSLLLPALFDRNAATACFSAAARSFPCTAMTPVSSAATICAGDIAASASRDGARTAAPGS